MTWRSVCVLALLATSARADTIVVKLGGRTGAVGWKRSGSTEALELKAGELRSAGLSTWSRAVPLDATRGWAVEARFAAELDAPSGGTAVTASDGRQLVGFSRRVGNTITLDGEITTIVDDDLPHTYRLEVQGGHHRLLIDGTVVLDTDRELTAFDVDPDPPHVSFGAELGAPGTPTTHWLALKIDTAPRRLVKSAFPVTPVARFSGPFADWIQRLALNVPQLAVELSRVRLSEDARACVAFAIVQAAGADLPARFRADAVAARAAQAAQVAHDEATRPHPICDPAGPCDCGRCPRPTSDADHAKDVLLASLATKDAAQQRRNFDDAVSWVFDSRPVARDATPTVAAPPTPPDPSHPQPARVSFSASNVKPLLDQLRTLVRRPRACR
jgi:hypothetical protein